METTAAAPYHSNQKLVIHLVRHAHGLHNLESERHRDPLKRIQYADPELSPLGWQQVREQRKDLSASGLLERIELVVTSPLTRTLQTSVGIFGSPLKDENTVGNGYQNGIKTPIFNHPPIIASELCRERLVCRVKLGFVTFQYIYNSIQNRMSKGRSRGSISQCRSRFPQVDFSLASTTCFSPALYSYLNIEREDDILWEADERESNESVAAKGIKLLARKEKEIAVVSHGVFLQQTLIALKNEFDCSIEKEFLIPFGNCECCEIGTRLQEKLITTVEKSLTVDLKSIKILPRTMSQWMM
ncbi:phosphoglycerate mutase-like protein 1 isoform X3 [Gossypium australe]|uniref:Phosphoglycerate mutase-like protein 1 isoform X3 n=1 Tax=Gossypium australe TaxID=47621 RepID=A0A5B6UP22_9ROSI|nr:phosphoglycerate mutase-like protein 1 isoform X3 [Gossypium australe]